LVKVTPAESDSVTPSTGPKLSGGKVLFHEVKPESSAEARAAGLQGTVSLYLEVKADGHPGTVQVMQGLGLGLDEKALEAVKQWEFKPNPEHPDELQSITDVDVQFRLDPPARWAVASETYSVTLPATPAAKQVAKPTPSRYLAPDSSACQSFAEAAVGFSIGTDGNPLDVAIRAGEGAAADAAVKAVEGWQFVPATANGNPVEAHGEVEFECRPDGMVLHSEEPKLPVFRVGGGVSAPVLISKIEPEYSEEARSARLQGTVRLYVQLSPAGKPTNIQVVQPLGMGLDEKAMEAVKSWRFKPGMMAGQPVTVEATIDSQLPAAVGPTSPITETFSLF
jgi:TonB family protein